MPAGRLSQLGAGVEVSSWGVAVAPVLFEDRANVLALDRDIAIEYPAHIAVGIRGLRRVRRGVDLVGGRIGFDAGPDSVLGMFLLSAFGVQTTSVVGSSLWTHTFTHVQSGFIPSLTIEVDRGTIQSNRFTGCRVNEITLSLDADPTAVLACEVDIIGKTAVTTTKAQATFPTEDAFSRTGFKFFVDSAEDLLCDQFSMTFRNLLERRHTAGGLASVGQVVAGNFEVEGRFRRIFENTDRRADYWAGDRRDIGFEFSVGSFKCVMQSPNSDFSEYDADPTEGLMEENVGFRWLTVTGKSPNVRLTDATSGY